MNICKCCEYEFTTGGQTLVLNGGYKIIFCPHCQIGFTCLKSEQKTERDYNLIDRLNSYFGRKIEFNRRYEQCLSLIRTHSLITSALDIGCNIGYWLYFLRKKGIIDTIGIEINDECRKAGREIFDLEICKDMQEVDRTFDLISFNDVLEHLDNPIFFLTQTFSMTHAGTIYFIQLPNYQSKMAKWFGKNWPWWDVPDHL